MPALTGRRLPLPLSRRWIADLMHASRHVPAVTAERRMALAEVAAARGRLPDPPPWAALFVKAYAVTAARIPALRRAYVSFPRPHLYEADQSVASLAVARDFEGEPAVFFGQLLAPDEQPLARLAEHIRAFRAEPVDQIRPFARLIRYTRYPRPVRRALWWLGLNLSGRHRAKTVGTFGVSAVGGAGAALANLIAPTATALTYGPLGPDGAVEVRLTFDHRVLDGLTAAGTLAETEAVLRTEVLRELGGRGGWRLDPPRRGTYNSADFGHPVPPA
jgi:hypothetical protein